MSFTRKLCADSRLAMVDKSLIFEKATPAVAQIEIYFCPCFFAVLIPTCLAAFPVPSHSIQVTLSIARKYPRSAISHGSVTRIVISSITCENAASITHRFGAALRLLISYGNADIDAFSGF